MNQWQSLLNSDQLTDDNSSENHASNTDAICPEQFNEPCIDTYVCMHTRTQTHIHAVNVW